MELKNKGKVLYRILAMKSWRVICELGKAELCAAK